MVLRFAWCCCLLLLPAAAWSQDPPQARRPFSGPSRLDRMRRWRINLPYDDPKAFIQKLGELKYQVGARKNDGKFLLFTDFSKAPPEHKEIDVLEFQKYAQQLQRLWTVTNDRNTTLNFQTGAGLSELPVTLFMFLPQDLEAALAKHETNLYDLTEAQVKEKKIVSHFDVTRNQKGFQIEVTKSYIDPNLKYRD